MLIVKLLLIKSVLVLNVGVLETCLMRQESVLMSLYTYWATIFLIPQKIISSIIAIYRNYLWDGKEDTDRSPIVAWASICRNKSNGWLNVRDCKLWNIEALGKYIWQILMKEDNLWVKWIHGIYNRNGNFWSHTPPNEASWA